MPDEHGFAHTSIGYVPITVQRGGIKYPTPTKGNTVAKTLNQQLASLKADQRDLTCRIATMEQKIKARRATPPPDQAWWTIDVRFTPGGTLYNYLVLRHGSRFYTTGTNVQDSTFRDWAAFLTWLDGVHEHSALIPLTADYVRPAPLEGRRGL